MKYVKILGMMALLVVLSLPSFAQRRDYFDDDDRTFWRFQSLPSSSRNYSRNYDRDYDRDYRQSSNRNYNRNSDRRYRDDDYRYQQNRRSQPSIQVRVEFDSRGNRIPNYNKPYQRGRYDDRHDGRRYSGRR